MASNEVEELKHNTTMQKVSEYYVQRGAYIDDELKAYRGYKEYVALLVATITLFLYVILCLIVIGVQAHQLGNFN